MKKIYKFLYALSLTVFFASTMMASTVGTLTTFSSGTALSSADMNANFTAVTTAVDDNQAQITANATVIGTNTTSVAGKQERVSSFCGTGFSIRVINADGTVVCEQDTDTTYSAGTGLNLAGTTFSVAPVPRIIIRSQEPISTLLGLLPKPIGTLMI